MAAGEFSEAAILVASEQADACRVLGNFSALYVLTYFSTHDKWLKLGNNRKHPSDRQLPKHFGEKKRVAIAPSFPRNKELKIMKKRGQNITFFCPCFERVSGGQGGEH